MSRDSVVDFTCIMIEEVHQVCYKVYFSSYFGKTKTKNYTFFADSFDNRPTFSKLCWCYWSTSGAGNLITGCYCVTRRFHFPSRGVFQQWIKQIIQQVRAPVSVHCGVAGPYSDRFLYPSGLSVFFFIKYFSVAPINDVVFSGYGWWLQICSLSSLWGILFFWLEWIIVCGLFPLRICALLNRVPNCLLVSPS